MATDDTFEPKLGRIRAHAPKMPKSYRGKVLHAVSRAGGTRSPGKGSLAVGKFGRGAGAARVMSNGGAKGARGRRVVVKARIVRLAGKGLQTAVAHLKYLQRDGVTREGEKGELYGAELEAVDGRKFLIQCQDDRHQFRFIVSPEDASQYDSLKDLSRKVMAQMEADLGTKLDWVAVDHFNTGHPHTHIVVRGRDDQGKDLVIAPEYMSQGFRHRVQAQVTLDLGPRSDLEIAATRQAEVSQERLTSIDRDLLREADPSGLVNAAHCEPFTHALRRGRLAQLERFGLATRGEGGQWRLRADMEATLRRMGERGDIVKAMNQSLTANGLQADLVDAQIHDGQSVVGGKGQVVTGRLIERGLSDEFADRHYVLVEATDGRVHYADIGAGDRTPAIRSGAIIQLTPNTPEVRPADLTIADVVKVNDGYYSVDAHLRFDPSVRQAFAETHARRLEAIRRATGSVTREADGRFVVGKNYVATALAYEVRQAAITPVKVGVLSDRGLQDQIRHNGVTWLDREGAAESKRTYAQSGFGKDVTTAMGARLQWLIEEGLVTEMPDGSLCFGNVRLADLQAREMTAISDQIAADLKKPFRATRSGDQIEGTLRQAVVIGDSKYAVVDRGRDFTLVPWRPVLEKHIDKTVSGLYRESGINWTIGRGQGLDRS